MTRILSILALSVAAAAVGCQSTDMNGAARNDDGSYRDSTASADQRDNGAMRDTGSAGLVRDNGRTASDQSFVTAAAAGGMYEVDAGNLALSKGQSDQVKKIAQTMVTDHTKANDELKDIAGKDNLIIPNEMNSDQKNMIAKLNSLSGSDFDKEYLTQQKQAHIMTIRLFDVEARGGRNAAVKSFASRTLPTLQEHLRMITGGEKGDSMRMGSDR